MTSSSWPSPKSFLPVGDLVLQVLYFSDILQDLAYYPVGTVSQITSLYSIQDRISQLIIEFVFFLVLASRSQHHPLRRDTSYGTLLASLEDDDADGEDKSNTS